MASRLIVALGRTRIFTRLAPPLLPALDLAIHRLTRGRLLPSSLLHTTLVLETTGHRSGLPRSVALAGHRAPDGSWLVVASNFGRPHHPAWSTNLLHHAHARITCQGTTQAVTAMLLTNEEMNRQRRRILTALPVYDTYAERSGRDIRVFRLHPASTTATGARDPAKGGVMPGADRR
ncbi:nitroreductase/quinone reductase family protein [Streptomyces sp. NPDC056660]|uniref:nitroreductase family deazaflavin-dependent oxidoreductase n=1 Tax=Streptomyces sp. NPDC056660 TaxID=3345897 RepID=UPI0036BE39BC